MGGRLSIRSTIMLLAILLLVIIAPQCSPEILEMAIGQYQDMKMAPDISARILKMDNVASLELCLIECNKHKNCTSVLHDGTTCHMFNSTDGSTALSTGQRAVAMVTREMRMLGCPPGWKKVVRGDVTRCYKMFPTLKSWDDAGVYCNSLPYYPKAYKAEVTSPQHLADIGALLASLSPPELTAFQATCTYNEFWVGAKRPPGGGRTSFIWQHSGHAMTFVQNQWDTVDPNGAVTGEDCVHIRSLPQGAPFLFRDESCTLTYCFVCEMMF